MDSISNKYVYKDKDISFLVIEVVEEVVSYLAQKEHRPFDDVYADFLASKTYKAIQDPETVMWYENKEFIADEYYRETGKQPDDSPL
jgi:hypothetical protein